MDYDFEGEYDETFDDGYEELEFDHDMGDRDIQPDLTKIINDDDDIHLDPTSLGLGLGLAEEIADEYRYREIERIPNKIVREPQKETTLISLKPKGEKVMGRGKFEAYVDSLIAGNNSKIPV